MIRIGSVTIQVPRIAPECPKFQRVVEQGKVVLANFCQTTTTVCDGKITVKFGRVA